jgi:anhydro-N-acetylmuramic acid kinase
MTYHALGLMSGSSLDGLDIALVRLEERGGKWSYNWIATECVPYPEEWILRLKNARDLSVSNLLRLHTSTDITRGRSFRLSL